MLKFFSQADGYCELCLGAGIKARQSKKNLIEKVLLKLTFEGQEMLS